MTFLPPRRSKEDHGDRIRELMVRIDEHRKLCMDCKLLSPPDEPTCKRRIELEAALRLPVPVVESEARTEGVPQVLISEAELARLRVYEQAGVYAGDVLSDKARGG